MTERTQRDMGDPESGPPVHVAPISTATAGDQRTMAPPAARGSAMASALFPGLGQIISGAWVRGIALMFAWGALLALLFFARTRIFGIRDTGTLDDYIALISLTVLLIAVWAYAVYDLTLAPQRRLDKGDSQWRIATRHFKKSKIALAGLIILVLLYIVAMLAPFLAPYDPIAQKDIVSTSYLKPNGEHWLGTDRFGRDILSRILYGARISLSIGFIATLISVTLGTVLGALAGFFGGKIDALIMRFTDMVLAFPRLVLLIMIVALFSPSIAVIITVLGLTQWPNTSRIVRGDVLSLREREFVQAAHALGMGKARIIFKHLIPNVLAPVIVTATLGIGNTIVLEAGLSFLGLGVQPPIPSWGNMVADGRDNLVGAWWVATFPGLTIVLTVLAFNLVGDGLRDALDPRLRS